MSSTTQSTPDPRATNAARHGILANTPVIPGVETEADWQRHRDGILTSLAPANPLQAVLAERIALQLWRLARVARHEADVTTREREYAQRDAPTSYDPGASRQQKVRHALLHLALPKELELEKIQRYEAHLSRELYRALREYKSLQALPEAVPQNCETNATPAPQPDAEPVPTSEPTPSLRGDVQSVGRSQPEQPDAYPVVRPQSDIVRTQNCETNPGRGQHARTPAKQRRR